MRLLDQAYGESARKAAGDRRMGEWRNTGEEGGRPGWGMDAVGESLPSQPLSSSSSEGRDTLMLLLQIVACPREPHETIGTSLVAVANRRVC